jgi:hypothetical protein
VAFNVEQERRREAVAVEDESDDDLEFYWNYPDTEEKVTE